MPEQRLVVAAIIVDDPAHPHRVLVARRTAPPALAGRWEFPGGKVEAGEDPRSALRRELIEELGIEITVGAELVRPGGGLWPISAEFAIGAWWAWVTAGDPVSGDSHDAVRWVTPAEVSSLDWVDVDADIAHTVLERHLLSAAPPP